jgi:hypothetical protein
MREGVERWQQVNTPPDKGGWLVWTVAPAEGRLPALERRDLATGVAVLASDDVVPLWAAAPDRWTLTQDGSIREPDPVRDYPSWLLEWFGAKWKAVAG